MMDVSGHYPIRNKRFVFESIYTRHQLNMVENGKSETSRSHKKVDIKFGAHDAFL
jgi:hypothetical protein